MHIYFLSPILHTYLHQRPQKLAEQFIRLGLTVTFVEPSGLLEHIAGRRKGIARLLVSSVLYHMLGILQLLTGAGESKRRIRGRKSDAGREKGTLRTVSLPLVFPSNLVDSRLLERLNGAVFRAALRRRVLNRNVAGERSVIIAENPFWGSVLHESDADGIYYDAIDAISLYAGHASLTRFREYEAALVALSRAVFATSATLERELKAISRGTPVVRIPNGVDASWFIARAREGGTPDRLRSVREPIAGYVGTVREWFDVDALLSAARGLPDVSFVIVGQVGTPERILPLRTLPNVYLLGHVPYAEVPLYVNRFNVGLIPFVPGPIAERTNPVKLYEYFALGKPVVASAMPDLEEFQAQGLVYCSNSTGGMLAALQQALAERDECLSIARRDIALQNSWESRASAIVDITQRVSGV